MPIQLILIDLDGTLVDTSQDITCALNYALNLHGFRELAVEETRKLIGEGVTRLVEKIIGDEQPLLRDKIIERFLEYYSEHLSDFSSIYPNVRETLERLQAYKKAVISNQSWKSKTMEYPGHSVLLQEPAPPDSQYPELPH